MTAMAFLLPITVFYGLLLISLGVGLLGCIGAWRSRDRRSWIGVSNGLAVLLGSWFNVHYQVVLWGTPPQFSWFTGVGLAPIALGVMGLMRWFLLKK